jgi:chromosome segregation ATPase
VDKIKTLKETADNLQSQVNSNNSSIGEKEKKIEELKQTIVQREAVIAQAEQDKQALQSKIDEFEQKLRDMTNEKDALNAELAQKNTLNAELVQKEKELNDRIAAFETKIQELEKQLQDKDVEINQLKTNHASATGTSTTAIQELQVKINELTAQNQNLVQRIIQATDAINGAVNLLNAIAESEPNTKSQEDVTALLVQIEQMIEGISRAMQGKSSASPSGSTPSVLPDNTPITVQGNTFALGVWILKIKDKINQVATSNPTSVGKYKAALDALLKATTDTDASYIINQISKNGNIFGGRRTKKNRKQKGGFTYKPTSRRRSISSTSTSTTRSSRRTRKVLDK